MAESVDGGAPVFGGAFRGRAWSAGVLATVAAVGIGAVLAVFFAATLAVIAVLGAAALGLTALAMRAKRSVRSDDPDLIEAHHVGGQSWVAYGWDRNGR
jgi:hypothetical protein